MVVVIVGLVLVLGEVVLFFFSVAVLEDMNYFVEACFFEGYTGSACIGCFVNFLLSQTTGKHFFASLGGPLIVQDIIIFGQVEEDGAINAILSKEWEGFTITGTLEGIFLDSGMAEGSYSVKIVKEGWPTASASATWWAVRQ